MAAYRLAIVVLGSIQKFELDPVTANGRFMGMKQYKALTIREAYRRGLKSHCDDRDDALETFIKRYCQHGYSGTCDLCTAWQNGYADQVEPDRRDHAKTCSRGLADRMNHEDCEEWQ